MNKFCEPWLKKGNHFSTNHNFGIVAQFQSSEYRDRAVACVNGCAGIEHPENIGKVVSFCEGLLKATHYLDDDHKYGEIQKQTKTLARDIIALLGVTE